MSLKKKGAKGSKATTTVKTDVGSGNEGGGQELSNALPATVRVGPGNGGGGQELSNAVTAFVRAKVQHKGSEDIDLWKRSQELVREVLRLKAEAEDRVTEDALVAAGNYSSAVELSCEDISAQERAACGNEARLQNQATTLQAGGVPAPPEGPMRFDRH